METFIKHCHNQGWQRNQSLQTRVVSVLHFLSFLLEQKRPNTPQKAIGIIDSKGKNVCLRMGKIILSSKIVHYFLFFMFERQLTFNSQIFKIIIKNASLTGGEDQRNVIFHWCKGCRLPHGGRLPRDAWKWMLWTSLRMWGGKPG